MSLDLALNHNHRPRRPRGEPETGSRLAGRVSLSLSSPRSSRLCLSSSSLSRLVKSIRTGTNLSGSEVLTKNWDQSIEEADAEDTFDKDMRSAVGGGARRRRRGVVSPHTGRRRRVHADVTRVPSLVRRQPLARPMLTVSVLLPANAGWRTTTRA